MLLSILIPTVQGREHHYNELVASLYAQCEGLDNVEILHCKDNKDISIGRKRQLLYDAANGLYSVQIDDDDRVSDDYIPRVLEALQSNPDCVCYLEHITYNGVRKVSCHSNRWADWGENHLGYDHIRTPYFKDVIKTEICKAIPVRDMRYAEDITWSRDLKESGLIQTEVFIDDFMYYYSYTYMNEKQLKERYGIKG